MAQTMQGKGFLYTCQNWVISSLQKFICYRYKTLQLNLNEHLNNIPKHIKSGLVLKANKL